MYKDFLSTSLREAAVVLAASHFAEKAQPKLGFFCILWYNISNFGFDRKVFAGLRFLFKESGVALYRLNLWYNVSNFGFNKKNSAGINI